MNDTATLDELKQRIAALWQQREDLKAQLESSRDNKTRRTIWQALETVDTQLSELDSRFKRLWDEQTRT